MSSLRGGHKDDRRDDDNERNSRRRRSRSHSRQRRQERHTTRSRTPERQRYNGRRSSRTPEHRRKSRSHEGGGEYNRRRDRHYSGRRHRNSRSRSHSSTRHTQHHANSSLHNVGTSHRGRSRDRQSHAYRKDTSSHSSFSAGGDSALSHKKVTTSSSESSVTPFDSVGAYYNLDTDEPFDKARIHREMEAKLRETLAKEGKVYPPPKTEASHPVFANDGSFLELFKKMQQQHQQHPTVNNAAAVTNVVPTTITPTTVAATIATGVGITGTTPLAQPPTQHNQMPPQPSPIIAVTSSAAASNVGSSVGCTYMSVHRPATAPQPPPPLVGRRRGGKILKTGVVAKQKAQTEDNADPKDFWSLYLAEVNKYKSNACESDGGKRPLVK